MATFGDDRFKKDAKTVARSTGSQANTNAKSTYTPLGESNIGDIKKLVNSYSGDKRARAYDLAVALASRDREGEKRSGNFWSSIKDSDWDIKDRADKYFDMLQDDLEGEKVSGAAMRGEGPLASIFGGARGLLNSGYNFLGSGVDFGVDRVGDLVGGITGNDELRQKIQNATTGETFAPIFSLGTDLALIAANPLTAVPILAGKGLLEHSGNIQEALSGVDSITGEELTGGQRGMKGAGAALGTLLTALPGASVAKSAGKVLEKEMGRRGIEGVEKATANLTEKEAAEKAALEKMEAVTKPVSEQTAKIKEIKNELGPEWRYDPRTGEMTYGMDRTIESSGRNLNLSYDADGNVFVGTGKNKIPLEEYLKTRREDVAKMGEPLGPQSGFKAFQGKTPQEVVDATQRLEAGAPRNFYYDKLDLRPGQGIKEFGDNDIVRLLNDRFGRRAVPNERVLEEQGYVWIPESETIPKQASKTLGRQPNELEKLGLTEADIKGFKKVRRGTEQGYWIGPNNRPVDFSTNGFQPTSLPGNLLPAEEADRIMAENLIAGNKDAYDAALKELEEFEKASQEYAGLVARRNDLGAALRDAEAERNTLLYEAMPEGSMSPLANQSTGRIRQGIGRARQQAALQRAAVKPLADARNAAVAETKAAKQALKDAEAQKEMFERMGQYRGPIQNPFSAARQYDNKIVRDVIRKNLKDVKDEQGLRAALKSITNGEYLGLGGEEAAKAAAEETAETGEKAAKGIKNAVKNIGKNRKAKRAEEIAGIRGPGGLAGAPLVWGSMMTEAAGNNPKGIGGAMDELAAELGSGNYGALLPWILAMTPAGKRSPISKRFARATGGSTLPYMAMKGSLGMDAADVANAPRYTDEDEKNLIAALNLGGGQ